MNNTQSFIDKAIDLLMVYVPKMVLAVIVLILGLWIIKIVVKALKRAMDHSEVEASLQKFLSSLVRILLKALIFISVASMLGIKTTSFVAIIGAAGLAIGLAMQGSMANFAGGVLILLFKPYKVGDFIEAQGYTGKVKSIQVFNTILKTSDNKTIIIPNGNLSNGSITNYSTETTRRIDMTFGISYEDDMKKAKETLERLVNEDKRIFKDPKPLVVVSELADSSVNYLVRIWSNASDLWNIYYDMQEKVKLTFDREGISIPFPQRDVHLFQDK